MLSRRDAEPLLSQRAAARALSSATGRIIHDENRTSAECALVCKANDAVNSNCVYTPIFVTRLYYRLYIFVNVVVPFDLYVALLHALRRETNASYDEIADARRVHFAHAHAYNYMHTRLQFTSPAREKADALTRPRRAAARAGSKCAINIYTRASAADVASCRNQAILFRE